MIRKKDMAIIGKKIYQQQQTPNMSGKLFVEKTSRLVIRWLFYLCVLSLHLNTNYESTVVNASYEAEDMLNELDRPSKKIPIFYYLISIALCKNT